MPADFRLMSERELHILRGKAIAKATTPGDILAVLNHLAVLEGKLDEADTNDALGPRGWRRYVGMPDAD